MPRSAPWFLLVVFLVGTLLARESRRPAGLAAGIDRAFFDWLSTNARRDREPARGGVTLVEIDDAIAESPGRLPLTPLDYALFLQAIEKLDPAVIAIEPILDWPTAQPASEEILLNQALTAPKLLLAARLGSAENARNIADLAAMTDVRGSRAALPQFPEVAAAPGPKLLPLAFCGVSNLLTPGVTVREAPLLFRCRNEVLPGFALQALMLWLRLAPSEVRATPGAEVRFGEGLRVPIDTAGRALLDAGAFGQVNRLEYDDLLLLTTSGPGETPGGGPLTRAAERVKGGIVVLGRTDHAARVFPTPASQQASAAEVLAWAIASLQGRADIRHAGWGWDAAIVVASGALGASLLHRRRRRAVGMCGAAAAGYVLLALALFESSGLWLPFALPLGLALAMGLLLWFLPKDAALPVRRANQIEL